MTSLSVKHWPLGLKVTEDGTLGLKVTDFLGDYMMEYQEYLDSDHWRKMKKRTIFLDKYRCRECGTAGTCVSDLHTHHINYDHLGKEPAEDLCILCASCHLERHSLSMQYRDYS